MQAAANTFQKVKGPEPSEAEAGYKARPGGETMRALAWFGCGLIIVEVLIAVSDGSLCSAGPKMSEWSMLLSPILPRM